jgi:hypothetical protein
LTINVHGHLNHPVRAVKERWGTEQHLNLDLDGTHLVSASIVNDGFNVGFALLGGHVLFNALSKAPGGGQFQKVALFADIAVFTHHRLHNGADALSSQNTNWG